MYPKSFNSIDGDDETEVQIYINIPSKFMIDHQTELLPTWETSIRHVIIVLQRADLALEDLNDEVAREKDHLRTNFLRFANELVTMLRDRNYLSEAFNPPTGYPLFSPPGELTLNDNSLVHTLLKFPLIPYKGCSLITHPQWGTAVYPSTIVTTADQAEIESCINDCRS